MFKNIKHIHFVGIGGSGMSGIAEVLLKLGYKVTGSDLVKSAVALRLEELGATVFEGHQAQNIEGAHVVVISTAVSPRNPEVKTAHQKNIPVISRIEMLAELARLKYTIAVGGTHGKTTTTSLIGQILQKNGWDPTIIVGGRLRAVGTGGILGSGDFLVAEADESDGSFLKLSPTISVITNIDNDHLDFWKTEERLLEGFTAFAEHVPFYGITYLCGDDPGVRKILPLSKRRYETYGLRAKWDWYAEHIETSESGSKFDVSYKGDKLGRLHIPLAGRHNVLNSLAATAVGIRVGLSFAEVAAALAQFEGVGRRIEIKGSTRDIIVVDDYGHHPTEIKATLSAVREKWPKRRIVAVFQPHRFTRTQLLYKDFARVLGEVDQLILLPIYPAGEKPIRGVSIQLIASHLRKKNYKLMNSETTALAYAQAELKPGDILLTLGAGDVWKIGELFLQSSAHLSMKLRTALPSATPRIKSEEPLSRHTTWGIGGPAEVFMEVHTLAELKAVMAICQSEHAPVYLLGWGSNVLVPDEGLRGCVVRLRGDFERIEWDGTSARVGGGVHLPKLAKMCAEKALSGVESLAGIPGTVGGALMSNAGTPRGAIGDVVEFVDILDPTGSVQTLTKEQIKLGYRQSNLVGRWIVSAGISLRPDSKKLILDRIKEELDRRAKTQPLGTKNVGSVFKNPPQDHAARMIEAVGLKGKQVGRLRFSPKHANFLENMGGATSQDVMALMTTAQTLVKEKFGVWLEPEVKIILPPGRSHE